MSSMPKREQSKKKPKEDVVKGRDVRKEERKDVNSANKKVKANQAKEWSKLNKCQNVCNKTSDAIYVYYKIKQSFAFRLYFDLIWLFYDDST